MNTHAEILGITLMLVVTGAFTYFASASQAEALAQAEAFKEDIMGDPSIEAEVLQMYSFTSVPTELPVTECLDSENSTCLPETTPYPSLVAS